MRGFLFTVSLVTMAMVIMSLSFYVMQSNQMEKADMITLSIFDTIKNNALWIENGFRDIVRHAGINITVENYTTSITERLPNQNAANFSDNVDNWKVFSENNSLVPVLLSVQDVKDYLPLMLRTSPVTYTHPNGLGGDTIRVENAGLVSNYSIELDIDISEAIDMSWTSIDNDPADLNFRIKVRNNTHTFEDNQMIDPDQTSTLSISMNSGTIVIDVGHASDSRRLVFSNPNNLNATLTTNITLSTTKNPIVSFPSEVITMQSSIINVSISRSVMIS